MMKRVMAETMKQFSLPRYEQLPDMGLYLEQTVKYVNQLLALEPVGFILSSIIYLFLQITLMSNEKNRKLPLFAIISVLLPIGVSALFCYVIKMPLPKGIIGF